VPFQRWFFNIPSFSLQCVVTRLRRFPSLYAPFPPFFVIPFVVISPPPVLCPRTINPPPSCEVPPSFRRAGSFFALDGRFKDTSPQQNPPPYFPMLAFAPAVLQSSSPRPPSFLFPEIFVPPAKKNFPRCWAITMGLELPGPPAPAKILGCLFSLLHGSLAPVLWLKIREGLGAQSILVIILVGHKAVGFVSPPPGAPLPPPDSFAWCENLLGSALRPPSLPDLGRPTTRSCVPLSTDNASSRPPILPIYGGSLLAENPRVLFP